MRRGRVPVRQRALHQPDLEVRPRERLWGRQRRGQELQGPLQGLQRGQGVHLQQRQVRPQEQEVRRIR